jgi:hypothetical protein
VDGAPASVGGRAATANRAARPAQEPPMPIRFYRLTVVTCALAWFLVGLHLPGLHRMTHHGAPPAWHVVAIVAVLAVVAVAGLVWLLRSPGRGSRPDAA